MQLEKLRKRPDDILSSISQSHSYEIVYWKPIILGFYRRMDGEVAPDGPALTPQGAVHKKHILCGTRPSYFLNVKPMWQKLNISFSASPVFSSKFQKLYR